jgi:hypothetical protein
LLDLRKRVGARTAQECANGVEVIDDKKRLGADFVDPRPSSRRRSIFSTAP